jgi:zinc/manganese transport system substrate-binding protein
VVDALADEVGDVAVVDLYSESLGEPGSGADTYAGMVRTNAERIAEALAP